MNEMTIRNVKLEDLDRVTAIELMCFPKVEAASMETFRYRIEVFPTSFLVAEQAGTVIGLINGCCTDLPTICDELFEADGGHDPNGANQMIFDLAVAPENRQQGVAAMLLEAIIERARKEKRKQVVLTCKSHLIAYYEKFGFVLRGLSESTHGGAEWYDMTATL
ncbi:GNAT family N-acetyltransferase [Fusibacter paucivorans]|uniref:GNAT family N-acetyltransferase n=1 Tax=Fusibacter paucivorans TaxID=76009 RepID=A0ABS5PLL7_9FIRM|nr:N-acetyltransferase [Fusibacter paucivorans]MBS7526059.1 GNAT family N-acetyltransferase [Fusibacter paucivorans]